MSELSDELRTAFATYSGHGRELVDRAADALDERDETIRDLVDTANAVCRTAGIIVEAALANEADPDTEDSEASYMFDMLNEAAANVQTLRALLTRVKEASDD